MANLFAVAKLTCWGCICWPQWFVQGGLESLKGVVVFAAFGEQPFDLRGCRGAIVVPVPCVLGAGDGAVSLPCTLCSLCSWHSVPRRNGCIFSPLFCPHVRNFWRGAGRCTIGRLGLPYNPCQRGLNAGSCCIVWGLKGVCSRRRESVGLRTLLGRGCAQSRNPGAPRSRECHVFVGDSPGTRSSALAVWQ